MFESIEIKKAANGFIVITHTEEESKEYVFESQRKMLKFVKDYVEARVPDSE